MAGTIGIKLANGDFYPILEGDSTVKKRLVLTTVHDGQESVQIDLFRSVSKTMLDAQYIGSLVVEDIKSRPKGEASIEMIISSDKDGIITADACNLDAGVRGEKKTLNVSHKKVESMSRKSDFDLENKRQTPAGLYSRTESAKEEKRKSPWLIMVFATIFIIIAIVLLWFFFLGGKDTLPREWLPSFIWEQLGYEETAPYTPPPPPPPAPVAEEPPPPPPPPPEPPPPPPEPIVIEAPATPPPARPATPARVRTRPPAPVSSYKVPEVIPRNGVAYQLRWGDTLWEISEAFYRDPWLYPRIARYNNISNPDHIISGRTIRIPPKD